VHPLQPGRSGKAVPDVEEELPPSPGQIDEDDAPRPNDPRQLHDTLAPRGDQVEDMGGEGGAERAVGEWQGSCIGEREGERGPPTSLLDQASHHLR
jgi:hypothetical protein